MLEVLCVACCLMRSTTPICGITIKNPTARHWICLSTLLLLCFATASAATAEPKRVLLLHSFGRDFAPWNAYARNIREELIRQSPEPIDLYEASLATARYAGGDDRPFVDYLRALFDKRRPLDLVLTIGAPAAGFVQQHRSELFPATPMLFTGMEQRRVALADLTAKDTVVANSVDVVGIIEHILRVLPNTTNIAVVIGNSPIEKFWVEQIRTAAQPFEKRVAFSWFNDLSLEDMLKRVAVLPERSAIFFVLLLVDAAGVPHEETKALSKLRAATNAPIFGYNDTFFGDGIVGGPLHRIYDLSVQAASVAVRILGGEPQGGIKTAPVGAGRPKYDWRELQRWNISETRLPPGSEIHFRQPSVWEQHRWQIVATATALLFQALLILALLFERHRRHAAELASRGHLLEVLHLNRTAAVDAMSSSIAHELNQPLGSILSNAEAADMLLSANPIDPDELRAILVDIRQADLHAAGIVQHMRGLLKKKSVPELQEFSLNEAVEATLHILKPEVGKRGIDLRTNYADAALFVRADKIHVQQVLINLAVNAMDAMQSNSSGLHTLTLHTALTEDGKTEVSVSDSGPGIPNDKLAEIFNAFYTTKQHGTGLGLSIARSIVETYGGKLWAENRPTGGAVFRFTLPLLATVPVSRALPHASLIHPTRQAIVR